MVSVKQAVYFYSNFKHIQCLLINTDLCAKYESLVNTPENT